MKIAVLTSGGDAPGMNAAIRAISLVGHAQGNEVVGVQHGFAGLLTGDFIALPPARTADILREGGTMLHSARCREFVEPSVRQTAREQLLAAGVDGLVVIGGNGSLTGAERLANPDECGDWPVHVIGIPASIDNDVALTSLSIGVDTAMNTIVEACDRIADTAGAHDRTFIIEVMGRDCGYLAMTSAVAGGADMVLFPEAERTESELVQAVVSAVLAVRAHHGPSQKVLAIKAEGIPTSTERLKELVDAELCRQLDDGVEIETRVTVLGHIVRGGRPSAFDRLLGSRFGNVAARAIARGVHRKMVAWMPPFDIAPEVGERSTDDPYCYLVELSAALDATHELLNGQSSLARWRSTIFDEFESVFLV